VSLQKDLNASVNFPMLCDLQVCSISLSLSLSLSQVYTESDVETSVRVVFALVYFALYQKRKAVDAKLRLADTLGAEVSGLLSSAFLWVIL
jgi:hypothetical protein